MMIQEIFRQCEMEETKYPLWILITKMMFFDAQVEIKKIIESLGEVIVLTPIQQPTKEPHPHPNRREERHESQDNEEERPAPSEEEESDSESESTSEEIPIEEKPIEEIIKYILTTRNSEEVKELINICRMDYRQTTTQEEEINIDSTIIDLLRTIPGDKWPIPKVGACSFAQECSATLTTIGQARTSVV